MGNYSRKGGKTEFFTVVRPGFCVIFSACFPKGDKSAVSAVRCWFPLKTPEEKLKKHGILGK